MKKKRTGASIPIDALSKLWKIMRLSLFFLFLFVAQAFATAGYSQQTRLTLKMQSAKVIDVLSKIEDQSEFYFLFNQKLVDVERQVTIDVENENINKILSSLFEGTNVSAVIKDRQIILTTFTGNTNTSTKQQKNITGKVTDSSGASLPGVSVVIKGTTTGTITDVNGGYSLSNVPANATLQFSFVGMKTQEIVVGGKTTVSVTLEEETVGIEEVVAIGYGTQRRSLVTNAISTVKINEENMRAVLSPSQLLQGRVAGVNISLGSGNLGSSERMSIRGISSLSASNEPLYVVDGIPISNPNGAIFNFGESMSSLSFLNLNDIESIDILKDAASAAIYGSRATNGVVVITTKSGKEGKSEFKINANTGISRFANKEKLKLADSKLLLEVYNEGVDNYNKQYGLKIGDNNYKTHLFNPFGALPDTDWLGLILQTGRSANFDASFSGGTAKTKFYIGTTYNSQEGIVKTNAIDKVNLSTKISHQMSPWLEVGASNSGNFVRNNQVPGANIGSTIIARAIEQRPFDRPYKPNGDYYVGGTDELTRHNPVQILNEQNAWVDNFRYIGNYYALFKYRDKLTWKTSISTDMGYTYDYVNYNANHPYGTGVGRIVEYNRFINNIVADNIINYNDKIGELDLGAMLGHSFQKISSRTSMIDGRGYPSPVFDVISVASEIFEATGNFSEFAMESYFARASLAYRDKYILNATIRTDGSSKFAPDARWGVFPSVSLGWNISHEDFMANSKVDLKLRASYGKTGNQESIGNYAYQSLMSGGRNYGNVSGIAVSSFGNRDLTWETADQYDIGFDLALLKGKINILFDVYQKNTQNLLYNMPVVVTSGMTSITSNIGSLRNRGIEFSINTHANLGKIKWTSQFNISANKNELTNLLGDKPISIGDNRVLQVGKDIGAYYFYAMEGIYQYDGEVPQAQYDLGIRAGDVKWRDVDDNGIINDNDRVVMGSSNPDFGGGWNNTLKYKNFQLNIFATYMYGNNVYAQWKPTGIGRIGGRFAALESNLNNRWTGPGTTNKYPRAINGDVSNDRNSDRWLEDGSFIRLRTITLGYNLPRQVLNRLHVKDLRFYCQADNLFLITNYSGWDPEVSKNMDPQYFGTDLFSVPQPRTITFGINLSL